MPDHESRSGFQNELGGLFGKAIRLKTLLVSPRESPGRDRTIAVAGFPRNQGGVRLKIECFLGNDRTVFNSVLNDFWYFIFFRQVIIVGH